VIRDHQSQHSSIWTFDDDDDDDDDVVSVWHRSVDSLITEALHSREADTAPLTRTSIRDAPASMPVDLRLVFRLSPHSYASPGRSLSPMIINLAGGPQNKSPNFVLQANTRQFYIFTVILNSRRHEFKLFKGRFNTTIRKHSFSQRVIDHRNNLSYDVVACTAVLQVTI